MSTALKNSRCRNTIAIKDEGALPLQLEAITVPESRAQSFEAPRKRPDP
jgi:hypothetical protein